MQLNQYDTDMIYLKIDKYEDEADRYVKFLLECVGGIKWKKSQKRGYLL